MIKSKSEISFGFVFYPIWYYLSRNNFQFLTLLKIKDDDFEGNSSQNNISCDDQQDIPQIPGQWFFQKSEKLKIISWKIISNWKKKESERYHRFWFNHFSSQTY
jgi:hypothetical protein